MRKNIIGLLVSASFIFSGAVFADVATQNVIVTSTDGSQNSDDQMEKSYLHMQQLDQNIQQQTKEIEAMQMQKKLNDIVKASNYHDPGFTVLRIEGFENNLQAVIVLKTGGTEFVKPGDVVNNNYQIKSVNPTSVTMIDLQNNQVLNAQFDNSASTDVKTK